MAYDSYRDPQHPPYNPSHDSYPDLDPYDTASYPRRHPPAAHEPHRPSRASSNDRSDGSQPSQPGQPVYDAVNSAFDQSEAASQIDPLLVAQITEQVRRQVIDTLKTSGQLAAQGPPPQRPNYGSPSPAASASASLPPRDVYTPPSPIRHETLYSTGGTNSPEPLSQDSFFAKAQREPSEAAARYAPRKNPSPPPASDGGSHYPPSSYPFEPPRPAPTRPSAARHLTEVEETAIEKTWGALFDADGQPTARLGQFLRGLAIHLINDYEPKHSIVVTPAKMLKFYEHVRIYDETYPWQTIFGTLSYQSISKLYRDLRCQHHFVQDGEQFDKMPHIPGLTPNGFQCWMTRQIQAHPETEFERLSKAVQDMPISNADDVKERFPKEISRRLFPKKDNLQCRQLVAAALSCDGQVPVRPAPMPPPPGPPPSQTPQYSYPADSAAVASDDDKTPCAVPIERERKPYSAQVGGGKVYNDFSDTKASSSAANATEPSGRHRSLSNAASQPPSSYQSVRNSEYPPSTSQTRPYPRNSAQLNSSSRRRSPSFGRNNASTGGYGTKSEGNIADIPTNYYNSNIYSEPDDDAKSKPRDSSRRQPNDDSSSRGYSGSRRQSTAYDDEYYRGRGATGGYAGGGQVPPPSASSRY